MADLFKRNPVLAAFLVLSGLAVLVLLFGPERALEVSSGVLEALQGSSGE